MCVCVIESGGYLACTVSDSDDRLCCMCDNEVNVTLHPCGHTVLCSVCAQDPKRCPTCRVSQPAIQGDRVYFILFFLQVPIEKRQVIM